MLQVTNPKTGEQYEITVEARAAARRATDDWREAEAVVQRCRHELEDAEADLRRIKADAIALVELNRPIPVGNGIQLTRFQGQRLARAVKLDALMVLGDKLPIDLRPWSPATIDLKLLSPVQVRHAKVGKPKGPGVQAIEDNALRLKAVGIEWETLLTDPGRAPDEVALIAVDDE